MEAILKFNLSDYEESIDFKIKMASNDMYSALFQITRNLKKQVEQEIDNGTLNDEYKVLDRVFELIAEECEPVENILNL